LTSNTLTFNYYLLGILALSAILGNIWTQGYILLASNNKHLYFSLIMVLIGCCNLVGINFLIAHNIDVLTTLWSLIIADLCLILSATYFIYKSKWTT